MEAIADHETEQGLGKSAMYKGNEAVWDAFIKGEAVTGLS